MREIVSHYNARWIPGGGLTVPFCGKTHIFYKAAVPDTGLVAHEHVHAAQIEQMGVLTVSWKALYAKFKYRSYFARLSELEFPAYQAQYPHLTEAELREYLESREKKS